MKQREDSKSLQFNEADQQDAASKDENMKQAGQVKVKVMKNPKAQKQTTKKKENLFKSQKFFGPDTVKTPCLRNIITQPREADIARYREKLSQSMRSLQGKPARQPAVFSGVRLPLS